MQFFRTKTLKANKQLAIIFQGAIKILGTGVFITDGRKLKARELFSRPFYSTVYCNTSHSYKPHYTSRSSVCMSVCPSVPCKLL